MLRTTSTTRATGRPRCRVCADPERSEYDRAVLVGRMSCAEVARRVGVHRSSAARHLRRHVEPDVATALSAVPELSPAEIIADLKDIYLRAQQMERELRDEGDWKGVRAFLQDQTKMAERFLDLRERYPKETATPEEKHRSKEEIRAELEGRLNELRERRQRAQSVQEDDPGQENDEVGEGEDDTAAVLSPEPESPQKGRPVVPPKPAYQKSRTRGKVAGMIGPNELWKEKEPLWPPPSETTLT